MSGCRSQPQSRPDSAALCGAAEGPGITIRAMLLEKLSNTVLDHIHIVYRNSKASSDLLRGNLKALAEDKDIEGAARYVMVCLENLKGPDKSFCASLFIQSDSLKSGNEGTFKFPGHELDILGVEIRTALHVTKVRLRLPMKIPEPVLFRLRELLVEFRTYFLLFQIQPTMNHSSLIAI